jgi:hypothetical protein
MQSEVDAAEADAKNLSLSGAGHVGGGMVVALVGAFISVVGVSV